LLSNFCRRIVNAVAEFFDSLRRRGMNYCAIQTRFEIDRFPALGHSSPCIPDAFSPTRFSDTRVSRRRRFRDYFIDTYESETRHKRLISRANERIGIIARNKSIYAALIKLADCCKIVQMCHNIANRMRARAEMRLLRGDP